MAKPRILYINENADSPVHHYLCNALQTVGFDVTGVLYNRHDGTVNWVPAYNLEVIKPQINKWRYRLDFAYKQRMKYAQIAEAVDLNAFDCVYASTMFSDGAFALRVKEKFGIPYVAAIRSTDISFYARRMPHLWHLGNRIANQAGALVGISPLAADQLRRSYAFRSNEGVTNKFHWISNATDDLWVDNAECDRLRSERAKNFLIVSTFLKRKNIPRTIRAILEVKRDYPDITFNIVGGKGPDADEILKYANTVNGINYLGRINDKRELLATYRANDAFILASWSETFGLVYIEALSQGLPIIYGRDTGVDGYFPDKVGYAVNPKNQKELESAIREMAASLSSYSPIGSRINDFRASNLAVKQKSLIESVMHNKPKNITGGGKCLVISEIGILIDAGIHLGKERRAAA